MVLVNVRMVSYYLSCLRPKISAEDTLRSDQTLSLALNTKKHQFMS